MPYKCYYGKSGTVYNATQHATSLLVNKQVRGKVPAKTINVLSILSTLRAGDIFLQCVNKNNQKKKEDKEEDTWVQLKCQPASPRAAHLMRPTERNTNC